MENEMTQAGQKTGRAKKIVTWIAASILIGGIIGVGITVGTAWQLHNEATNDTYSVATENGYSGNSSQQLVSVVQTDDAIAEVSEKYKGSIVTVVIRKVVQSQMGTQTSTGMGSGVVMKQDDEYYYILTNAHVVDEADAIVLYYYDEDTSVAAELVGEDSQSDIAVLRIEKASLSDSIRNQIKVATFGDSDALRIGQTAIAIGSPEGLEFSYSVTVGVISGTQRQVEVDGVMMNYLQTDAAINPGNSGGALLNTDGEVIGITSAKIASDDVEGIGFAIPINTALEVANELMENGYVEWLSLGLEEYDFLEQAIADAYHVPTGIVVYQTVTGGPAAKAGLQKGDLITEIDGQALETATDVQTLLSTYQVGDTVALTVIRNRDTEHPLTLKVVLMTESEIEELQQPTDFWGNNH